MSVTKFRVQPVYSGTGSDSKIRSQSKRHFTRIHFIDEITHLQFQFTLISIFYEWYHGTYIIYEFKSIIEIKVGVFSRSCILSFKSSKTVNQILIRRGSLICRTSHRYQVVSDRNGTESLEREKFTRCRTEDFGTQREMYDRSKFKKSELLKKEVLRFSETNF